MLLGLEEGVATNMEEQFEPGQVGVQVLVEIHLKVNRQVVETLKWRGGVLSLRPDDCGEEHTNHTHP